MSVNTNTQPKGTDSIDRDPVASTQAEILDIEAEMSALMTENPNLLGGEDVMELLERLTSADTMAEGLESKIDSVLENLDSLLAILGPVNETDIEGADNGSAQESIQDDTPAPVSNGADTLS